MSEKQAPLEQLFGSSMLTCCQRCGSTATYRGSPDKINAAAKEFYELHERCYQQTADARKGQGAK